MSPTKFSRLMLFNETVAVCCESNMKHTNTLCGQNAKFCYVALLDFNVLKCKENFCGVVAWVPKQLSFCHEIKT
jgi:hypothetical protein